MRFDGALVVADNLFHKPIGHVCWMNLSASPAIQSIDCYSMALRAGQAYRNWTLFKE